MPSDTHSFFLSYAWSDREFVSRLKEAIVSAGGQPIDPATDVPMGASISDAIIESIRGADAFVFIVPEKEGAGKAALSEIGAARAMGKQIVALVQGGVADANTDVALRLSDIMILDAEDRSPRTLAQQVFAAVSAEAA